MTPSLARLHFAFAFLLAATLVGQVPDPAALLREVKANQARLETIRENYTYHEIIRIDDLDARGVVKGTETNEYEAFFVRGRRVRRLVKKNGVELNPRAADAEQKRIQKEVEADMKGPPGPRPGRGGGGGRVAVVSEILSLAKTSNPRRVSLRGRDTLAFDFAGDREASTHGMEQNAAKKLAGTVWIDEADKQVARLEVEFYEDFHLVGGLLASIQKGTRMTVDQSPIGDGLWMQTGSENHLAARLVLSHYRQNVHIEDFDFRKFDIGTVQNIHTPGK